MADTPHPSTLEERVIRLEALTRLHEAHVENLIERVRELEEMVEAMLMRLTTVERATPWKKPRTGPPKR